MSFYYGDSLNYAAQRRRRQRQLLGFSQVEEVIGAEVAAGATEAGSSAARAIGIGVATGVLTLLVNRLIESMFPRKR